MYKKISHKFKEAKAIGTHSLDVGKYFFTCIVWLILDRLKLFSVGVSIQNLEIMKENQNDPLHKGY